MKAQNTYFANAFNSDELLFKTLLWTVRGKMSLPKYSLFLQRLTLEFKFE